MYNAQNICNIVNIIKYVYKTIYVGIHNIAYV